MLTLGAMVLALAFEGPTTLALPTLLVGRLLQAGCGAGIIPASQALVADLTPRGRRANGMATMSATLALGSILGSALLLATGESGLQTGFAILAGMSVLASVLAAGVPSDRQEPVPRPDASANSALRMLWPNLLATLAGYLAYTMILPLHGLRLLDKGGVTAGQANAQAGMILLAGAVALFLAQAAISVAARPNPRRLFRLGSVGALVGFVALVLAGDAISMAVAVALIGGCLGLAVSSNLALISLAVGPDLQGRAAGANAAMRALGIALGPLVGLGLYQPGGILPFVAAFVMIVVVVLASLRA
jgi:MFS family permease